ncbi:MAG: M20/M25/M40 family metallo-hydrolase [Candidatus Marsarchaeota archaeon]|nr:M20/M25/M40 family metallo-hydrolase [Candidatus Marsarchaeota archaeon]
MIQPKIKESDISFLKELVAIDTATETGAIKDGKGGEGYTAITELLQKECRSLGATRINIITPKEAEKKAKRNIVAYFDNGAEHTLALNAHYDTVDTSSEGWRTDPLKVVEKNGRLYGRGTNDDKGAIVAILSAIRDSSPSTNIELFLTCDEEVGSADGMDYVVDHFKSRSRSAVVVDADPFVFVGASGGFGATIKITGKGYHAGWPHRAVNPIQLGMPFLERIVKFSDIAKRDVSRYVDAGPDEYDRKLTGRFSITTIHAGNPAVTNTIPYEMAASFNARCIPEGSVGSLFERFERFFETEKLRYLKDLGLAEVKGGLKIWIERKSIMKKEPYVTPENEDIVKRMVQLTGDKQLYGGHGGNDASAFVKVGIPAVSYGTFNESAHKTNEFVAIKDLEKVKSTLTGLLESY